MGSFEGSGALSPAASTTSGHRNKGTRTKGEKLEEKRGSKGGKGKIPLNFWKDRTDTYIRVGSVLANTLAGICIPAFVYFFFATTLAVLQHQKWSIHLTELISICVAVFVFAGLGAFLPEWSAERQVLKLKLQFYQAVLSQPMAYFDGFDATSLGLQLSAHAATVRGCIGYKKGLYSMYVGLAASCAAFAIYTHKVMGFVSLAGVPVIVVGAIFLTRQELIANKRIHRETEIAAETAQEMLAAVKTVKAFGLEQEMERKFAQTCDNVYSVSSSNTFKTAFFQGLVFLLMMGTAGMAFIVYTVLAIKNTKPSGSKPDDSAYAGLCAIFAMICGFYLSKVFPLRAERKQAVVAVSEIVNILRNDRPMDPFAKTGAVAPVREGRVEFDSVAFAYPSAPERKIFNGVSFTIRPGESVALVGGSGCGKSTIVQLIERFYDPESGVIRFDGTDLRHWNLQELRKRIALVQQEPRLFGISIKENIRIGKPEATDEEIIAAAKQANCHDFICTLTDKYDTFVGEGGSQLSGGQKQRIAIARAIIKDPILLILDEATSALDVESERVVQETLEKVVADAKRTTVIVAHRLSTIRRADRILVFDNPSGDGSIIVEEGTHDELLKIENGLYATLVTSQMGDSIGEDVCSVNDPSAMVPMESLMLAKQYSKDLSKRTSSIISLKSKYSMLPRDVPAPPLRRPTNVFAPERETEKKFGQRRHFRRLMAPAIRKPHFALAVLGAACVGAIWPIYSLWFAKTFAVYTCFDCAPETIKDWQKTYSWQPFAIGLLALLGQWMCIWASNGMGMESVRGIRNAMFANTLKQDGSFFDVQNHSSSQLTHLVVTETSQFRKYCGENLAVLLSTAILMITCISINFTLHKYVGLVVIGVIAITIPTSYLSVWAIDRALRGEGDPKKASSKSVCKPASKSGAGQSQTPRYADMAGFQTAGSIISESVINIRNVNAYTMQKDLSAQYGAVCQRTYDRGYRMCVVAGLSNGFSYCVKLFLIAGYALFVGHLASKEKLPIQEKLKGFNTTVMTAILSAELTLTLTVISCGRQLVDAATTGLARKAAAHAFALLDRRAAIDDRSGAGHEITSFESCKFDQVAFRYPTRPEYLVYRDVTFTIPRGKVVALVGASGCGKSTAVQLLLRFYKLDEDVASGSILLNGRGIEEYSVPSLRSITGLVSQEPSLFWTSVEENVAMGNRKASTEEIVEALKQANAWDFVSKLDGGLQFDVGRGGQKLSGGQKQRVAIARALVRKPKIMILDEATSALDANSEKIVQKTLDDLIASRDSSMTSLIIAHRLSSIRNADQIVVFSNKQNRGSQIVEVGTHEELVRIPNGIYAGLVKIAQYGA